MMKKLKDYLLIGVFIMTALLAAVAGLTVYSGYMEKKAMEEALFQQRKEEILARNAEAQNRVLEMEVEIIRMQEDVEALQAFIDETVNAANEVQIRKETGSVQGGSDASPDAASDGSVPVLSDSVSGDEAQGQSDAVSGNDVSGQPGSVSDNDVEGPFGSVSGNDVSGQSGSVSGNDVEGPFGSVSGNDESGYSSVSGNQYDASVSGNTVSGNGDMTVSGNDDFGFLMGSVSENDDVNYYDGNMTSDSVFDEWRPIYEQSDMTLEERKELRTSYQETLEVNQADRERIAENQYDFSGVKIACLGDSITKAANLEDEENYEQYAYPAKLQELLGAQEVYNLGIGGSSIGRYWADAFVDRYMEIPADSDIIIVMGGTNDGFCVSDEEFGSLEEREYHTFCGDLDELMRGLRENYPDAQIFFATPLPNVLQDYLMSEREYLLPQKKFVEVIQVLADEYDFELIDLYNSNVLDSHDANIITEYMPDGVHGNEAGYQVLAEHFAGEIVKYYNEDFPEAEENAAEEGISAESNGTGTGAAAGINAQTNTGAAAGVTGNAGANAGAATVIGGNAGANTGNGTENETGANAGTDIGEENAGIDGAQTETGDGNGENAVPGEDNGTETGSDADGGDSGMTNGTDAGENDGTGSGSGENAESEDNNGTKSDAGDDSENSAADTGTKRNAGVDTGTGTADGADANSERKQYRYEY